MIQVGSLFSGIGGFDLGLERSFKKHSIDCKIAWQVEQNKYCQTILRKHWPDAKIYDDVRDITKNNVSLVDILIGGFPCQDISIAGKQGGIHAEKSGLWWEMLRIISELRPRIVVLENVSNIIRLGGLDVLGSLAAIGYNAEWTIISARMFGAPHLRKRWFCVCYPSDSDGSFIQRAGKPCGIQEKESDSDMSIYRSGYGYWRKTEVVSPLCHVDDGIPDRLARLRALGNAIVPQCSEWVFDQVIKSGLL